MGWWVSCNDWFVYHMLFLCVCKPIMFPIPSCFTSPVVYHRNTHIPMHPPPCSPPPPGIILLANFNFQKIVELLNTVYCFAELLEFAAFIWLRIKLPHLYRPFKVPLPTWACVLMLLPASTLLAGMIVVSVFQEDMQVISWSVGTVLVGSLLYPTLQVLLDRGYLCVGGLHMDTHHLHTYTIYTHTIYTHTPSIHIHHLYTYTIYTHTPSIHIHHLYTYTIYTHTPSIHIRTVSIHTHTPHTTPLSLSHIHSPPPHTQTDDA